MSRKFLVSDGVVRSPVPWADPKPPNTLVISEEEFMATWGSWPAERIDAYASPKRRGRPPKAESTPPPDDVF